jgi:uncharacterized protein
MITTAFYASLLAPLFIFLSVRVIRFRRGSKFSLGDGGDASLLRLMRVQANFAEYTPFALLLIALAENAGTQLWMIHMAGAALVLARYAHAFGVSRTPEYFPYRVFGMAVTFTVIGAMAVMCLVRFLMQMG